MEINIKLNKDKILGIVCRVCNAQNFELKIDKMLDKMINQIFMTKT